MLDSRDDPIGALGRKLRDHVDLLAFYRLVDRVGRGENGNLLLLVPKLGLLGFELVVQLGVLMAQLELLMPKIQHEQGERDAAEKTNEEFDHDRARCRGLSKKTVRSGGFSTGNSINRRHGLGGKAKTHIRADGIAAFEDFFVEILNGGPGVSVAELFGGDFPEVVVFFYEIGVVGAFG